MTFTVSTGLTITFATGFLAEVLDVTPPGAERLSIDTFHMLTSKSKTFTPAKLVDWGEVELEMAFDPSVSPPIRQQVYGRSRRFLPTTGLRPRWKTA